MKAADPIVEVMEFAPKKLSGPHTREDIDGWLTNLPSEGQSLRITFESEGECKKAWATINSRRKRGVIKGVGIARRGVVLFIWKVETT